MFFCMKNNTNLHIHQTSTWAGVVLVPTLFKIAPNGQISEFTGSRLDQSSPNIIARLFYFKQIKKNDNTVKQNAQTC